MEGGVVNNLSNSIFRICKCSWSIWSRVWKEENKNNWNEFGNNILCPFSSNTLQICAVNGYSIHWIFFSFFRKSIYCGYVLLVWPEFWLQKKKRKQYRECGKCLRVHVGCRRCSVKWKECKLITSSICCSDCRVTVISCWSSNGPSNSKRFSTNLSSSARYLSWVICVCVCVCVNLLWLCFIPLFG